MKYFFYQSWQASSTIREKQEARRLSENFKNPAQSEDVKYNLLGLITSLKYYSIPKTLQSLGVTHIPLPAHEELRHLYKSSGLIKVACGNWPLRTSYIILTVKLIKYWSIRWYLCDLTCKIWSCGHKVCVVA